MTGGMTGKMTGGPGPDRPFAAPWHAAAFAMTVHLHERGLFTWPDWAEALGRALAADGKAGRLDGSDDYYRAWLAALQELLAANGVTGAQEIATVMKEWEAAYLATPHGEPVTLAAR